MTGPLIIMNTEIKLEKFQGPLDLLLQLIDEEKMNISDVALSAVTEQYLEYLEKLDDERPEELADFLVVATRLVYFKSRNLLPYLYPEEDEGPSLADQLKLYKEYVEASRKINILWQAGRVAYGRLEPKVLVEGFVLPQNAGLVDLSRSMAALLKRLAPLSALPRVTMDRGVSIKQKIELLREMLKKQKRFSFSGLLSEAASRTEVIVSFLALLELVKEKSAVIRQENNFGDMTVEKI